MGCGATATVVAVSLHVCELLFVDHPLLHAVTAGKSLCDCTAAAMSHCCCSVPVCVSSCLWTVRRFMLSPLESPCVCFFCVWML